MYINKQLQPPEILFGVYVIWHFPVYVKLPGKVLNFHFVLCLIYLDAILAVFPAYRKSLLRREKLRSVEQKTKEEAIFSLICCFYYLFSWRNAYCWQWVGPPAFRYWESTRESICTEKSTSHKRKAPPLLKLLMAQSLIM